MHSYRFLTVAVFALVVLPPCTIAKEGDAVKGLKATADAKVKDGAIEVTLTLTNESDKPITVCTWIGMRAIDVKWVGPDGKPRESLHYEWMKAARIRNVIAEDFVAIEPGKSLVYGPHGKDSVLQIKDAEKGMHKLTLSFESKQDGKAQGRDGAWIGKVTAAEVAVNVK